MNGSGIDVIAIPIVPSINLGVWLIMVGGAAEDFAAAKPIFDAVGKTIVHVGPSGSGQTVKAANQLIVGANIEDMPATKYISLFPIVILTGMVERFWTRETEDGTSSSFKTLLTTMFIAATIALVCGVPWVLGALFRYPELIGVIMACQLLIGRYTGYRLMELWRFRDFLRRPPEAVGYTFDDGSAMLS